MTPPKRPHADRSTHEGPAVTQTLSRQERRAAALDDPRFENLRAQRPRRLLSATLLVIVALEAATFVLLNTSVIPAAAFVAVMIVLVIGLVFTLGALKASTRGIEELSLDVLDERQTQIRGVIYARSYALLSWVLVAALAVLLVGQSDLWAASATLSYVVAAIVIQLVVSIPTLVTALQAKA